MSELLGIAATWWLISLSGILMPGPVSAIAISEGTRRGAIAGPLITAGHAAAEIVMLAVLAVGLTQVLKQSVVVGLIGVLGGAVLGWMGWGILSTARSDPTAPTAPVPGVGAAHLAVVRAGVLTTVGNPYWLLWWLTVGASYFVLFSRFGWLALVVVFYAGHTVLDLAWNSFLAVVVGSGRGRIPPAVYRIILGVCGVFVMAMSAYFLISGVRFLRGP
ncbi:MAG: LysE family transporter [Armatimonadota bacterium]|nr:LysE family transporter [Armatimonadota bacterium]MDR7452247.1 LysE family transporter [Armatimonadota bacterium]MDR7466658.1 LysE family transporter [Armatimonadota bacterium]MDR7492868.1 LysE family transporter [Armatimonadota bacterium]MDR7498644.1 LysE family transporter [Armatimonadota bacterium]